MSTVAEFLTEVHERVRIQDWGEAKRLIDEARARYPQNADLAIEQALILCYHQEEGQALELLERYPKGARAQELQDRLNDYITLRDRMSRKLGVNDPVGNELLQRIRKLAPETTTADITLAACLIVKNEEKHLERCLKSVAGRVDEIVVVDTGSTDRTVEIAQAFGAKIGHFRWIDDFSAARNAALDLASTHWALWIDADEEMTASSWPTIHEGLIRPHFGGYYLRIINFMSAEDDASRYVHSPVRIFQRLPGVRFEGRIHEQVSPSFDRLGLPCATLQKVVLNHYGYMPEDMQAKDKVNRAVRLLEREVREQPTDAFQWFNLANAYCVANRLNDAIHAARMCLKYIHPKNTFGSLTYQIVAGCLTGLGRASEALVACDEARERSFFTKLNQFEKARALLNLGRNAEALVEVDKCLAMDWPESLTGDIGIHTHKTHALKGQILSELGELDEAMDLLEFALDREPGYTVARYGRALTLERMKRFAHAESEYRTMAELPGFSVVALKGLGRVCAAQGRPCDAATFFEAAWRERPEDTDAWIQWVQNCEVSGNVDCTLRAYEAFSHQHDPNPDVLINWGRALATAGDLQKALNCFTEAIRRDPRHVNGYLNAGDILFRLHQYADAAHLYESALRIDPANSEAWFVLGNCLAYLGLVEGAEMAYRQCLQVDSGHSGARYNLAILTERPEDDAVAA